MLSQHNNTANELQFIWELSKTEKLTDNPEQTLRGEIYIHMLSGDFPCKGWKDYPISIIISFITSAFQLRKTPHITKRNTPFSPYSVVISLSEKDIVTLDFLRSYLPKPLKKLPSITLQYEDFCDILLGAGQSLLDTCRSLNIGSQAEIRALEKSIKLLKDITEK